MFLSSLDIRFISFFQWIVRQIELYTEITRKDVIGFCLTLAKYSLILFLGSLVIGWSSGQIAEFVNFINFLFYGVSYFDIKKASGENRANNILPIEILTRKINRMMLLFLVPLALPLLFFLFWSISQYSEKITDYLAIYETVTLALVINLIFCLEYLICTISLPPGEKERRRAEKEIKGLTPIPIR